MGSIGRDLFITITFITLFLIVIIALALLLRKQGNKISNRIFSAVLLVYGVLLSVSFSTSTWMYEQFLGQQKLIFMMSLMAFLVGPLLFMYLKSLVLPRFSWNWKRAMHFAPYFIASVYGFIEISPVEDFIFWLSPLYLLEKGKVQDLSILRIYIC